MSYGLALKSNSNAYIIDGFNSGLSFKGKYTSTSISSGLATFNLTGITGTPIVFVKTTDTSRSDWTFITYSMVDNGGGSWTVKIGCGLFNGSSYVHPSNVVAYVFHPYSSTNTGYGVAIKNTSGTTVFNSYDIPLILSGYRVVSQQSGYDNITAIYPDNQSLTSGTCTTSSAIFCPAFGGIRTRVTVSISVLSFIGAGCGTNYIYFRHSGYGLGSQPVPYNEYYLEGGKYVMVIDTSLYD